MKLQAKDLKPGDQIKEAGSWRTVTRTQKKNKILWIFFKDEMGQIGVSEDRKFYVRRPEGPPVKNSPSRAFAKEMGTGQKIKKGQVYCKVILELELVAERTTDEDEAEHEIVEYVDREVEIIGRYAASRGVDALKISNKNLKWRVE